MAVEAASFYVEAVERRRELGNRPESAYALLGQGSCLVRLGAGREWRFWLRKRGFRPAQTILSGLRR